MTPCFYLFVCFCATLESIGMSCFVLGYRIVHWVDAVVSKCLSCRPYASTCPFFKMLLFMTSIRKDAEVRRCQMLWLSVGVFFFARHRNSSSLWCSTGLSSSSSAQWKNKTICTTWSRGLGVIWRQFKEQHILIYGWLNEVAGTFFFCTNFKYLFTHRCVCIY